MSNPLLRLATEQEQQYLDLAAYYVERAMLCFELHMWPEAEVNFGSALESLLRMRYGSKSRLVDLVGEFDKDPLFDDVSVHDGSTRKCVTCFADKVRTLRNAVHPDCWQRIKESDVTQALTTVVMLYHVLVVCSIKIAVFQISPDTKLHVMEQSGVRYEKIEDTPSQDPTR
jgi:hypothetical protein